MKLLKFLVDNNLLQDMKSVDDLKIGRLLNLDQSSQPKPFMRSDRALTIGLSLVGLSLGWILGGAILLMLRIPNKGQYYQITESIRYGFPILFAAGGVLISYFMTAKKS